MRVLVIGGAGYIGSHVGLELKLAGHEVHVFDNLSSGLRQNLLYGFGFTHGDIMIPDSIRHTLKDHGPFDGIVHLAAYKAAGESMIKPEKYATNNIAGTINILNAASEAGIRRIVFSSSAATYGEPKYLPIDEKHPTNPENFYGFTKLEIERILAWYSKLKGMRFAALRYFNAAGYDPEGRITGLEQNPANLLPVIMEVAVGSRPSLGVFGNDYDTPDGTGIRDYVHVSDLARAHVLAMDWIAKNDKDTILNLGSEEGVSVLQMVDSARRISKKPIEVEMKPRRSGDPARLVASSARARSELGWAPQYSDVDSLISTTWQAYRNTFGA